MVQSIDSSANRPNYNAVKINIKKPEVNAAGNKNSYVDDNGIYNAVNIEIDNPSVNTEPKRIYDYPQAEEPVTFDMANINRIPLPQGFNVAYTTTNVILPKMEQEIELPEPEEIEEAETEDIKEVEVPAPNYTTVEEEKENIAVTEDVQTSVPEEDKITEDVKIMEAEVGVKEPEDKAVELKRPEIIPGEDIQPEVDIPLVISNLTNPDFDIQAQQMEEIARLSLDDKENAVPYIVREVFSNLIDISKKDTANLAAPTEEQVQARKKLITNFILMENARKNNTQPKLPYQITEADVELANQLSPMEMAERNKEYALFTMAILAKIYADEVERHTGNIVPLTDLPGSAAMVDALRYNPNSEVKIAAIDALRHIQRPEYKEELNTLYTLAQADSNPQVAMAATRALNS